MPRVAIDPARLMPWAMLFVRVVELGSFTAAAAEAGLSKGLVSRQIRQLETALGYQLLYRTTRRLDLTEAGKVYFSHCRDWLARFAAASQALDELASTLSGNLRMTVPTSFGGAFMAEALLAFRSRYPGLEIELDLSREPRDLLADGYDLAIRANLPPPDTLVHRPLANLSDWLVCHPALLERHGPVQTPDDLAGWPALRNTYLQKSHTWVFSKEGRLYQAEPGDSLIANDYQFLLNLVLKQAGIARLPPYLVIDAVENGQLVRLLPDYQFPAQPLYLIYPQRLPQPAKVQALIHFLAEWFAAPERQRLLGVY